MADNMILFELTIILEEQQDMLQLLRNINKYAFPKMSVKDINSGDCYNWAAIVKRFIPEAETIRFEGHAFVKIRNKFYDAERLDGLLDWKKLPTNKSGNLYRDYDVFTEEEFYKKFKIHKSHIDKLVKQVKEHINV
jgi:hypothetical protein